MDSAEAHPSSLPVGKVQAAAKREAEAAQWEAELARARAPTEGEVPPGKFVSWRPLLALVAMCLLIALSTRRTAHGPAGELPVAAQTHAEEAGSEDGGIVGLGSEILTAPARTIALPQGSYGITLDIPKRPFPGQRRPDDSGKCRHPREIAINGGCWIPVAPPCEKDEYKWESRCYYPSYDSPRQPSSDKP